MRLELTSYFPDIKCPSCGASISVDNDYEDCKCSFTQNPADCPNCGAKLLVTATVDFKVELKK